jgi:hypothetical protein
MRVDVSNSSFTAYAKLNEWRQRYSDSEYPGKVVINIFYRKYIIDEMWQELISYFNKNHGQLWYRTKNYWRQIATQKVNGELITLIQDKKG